MCLRQCPFVYTLWTRRNCKFITKKVAYTVSQLSIIVDQSLMLQSPEAGWILHVCSCTVCKCTFTKQLASTHTISILIFRTLAFYFYNCTTICLAMLNHSTCTISLIFTNTNAHYATLLKHWLLTASNFYIITETGCTDNVFRDDMQTVLQLALSNDQITVHLMHFTITRTLGDKFLTK